MEAVNKALFEALIGNKQAALQIMEGKDVD